MKKQGRMEVSTSIHETPEVVRIAADLGLDVDVVVGRLLRLMAWIHERSRQGSAAGEPCDLHDLIGEQLVTLALRYKLLRFNQVKRRLSVTGLSVSPHGILRQRQQTNDRVRKFRQKRREQCNANMALQANEVKRSDSVTVTPTSRYIPSLPPHPHPSPTVPEEVKLVDQKQDQEPTTGAPARAYEPAHERPLAYAPEGQRPTTHGVICRRLVTAGIVRVNPSYAPFVALVDSGLDEQVFVDTARECVEMRKPSFQYLCSVLAGRAQEAAAPLPPARKEPKPASHQMAKVERRPRVSADKPPAALTEIFARLGIAKETPA